MKLTAYSVFCTAFLLKSENAISQVIYTDIDPDITLDESGSELSEYFLDINNDLINDFRLEVNNISWSSGGWGAANGNFLIEPLNENEVAYTMGFYTVDCEIGSTDTVFLYLAQGFIEDTIDIADNFNAETNFFLKWGYDSWPCSKWFYTGSSWADEKFAGLKIKIDGKTHFGWLHLKTEGYKCNSVLVYDYAYEAAADHQIIAGDKIGDTSIIDTSTFISDSFNPNISLYTFNNIIYLHTNEQFGNNISITVIDLNGKIIRKENVEQSYKELVFEAYSGMFIVEVSSEKSKYVKKITLQN